MGLPLFVEPAKSAPSTQALSKDSATSPRADSRHAPSRSEIRDRRNGIRRAGVRIYGPMQRGTRNHREQRPSSWADSPREQDRAEPSLPYLSSGVILEALRDMTSDDRRRERIEERMFSFIRNGWRDSPPPPPPPPPLPPLFAGEPEQVADGVDLGWWSTEPPLATARSGRSEHQERAASEHASRRRSPRAESSSRTLPSLFGRAVHGIDTPLSRGAPSTRQRGLSSPRPANTAGSRSRGLGARQQMHPRHATRAVDGLGDRDRSLSPEVWDTLLSTLTPDPQPPSAGSSFASGSAASQTTGPSSGTPTTAPDVVDEVQMETVCESGCEYSDNDLEVDYEPPDYVRIRRRRGDQRDMTLGDVHSGRVPDYNLDGMSEPPYLGNVGGMAAESFSAVTEPTAQGTRNSGHGRATRQINARNGALTIYESTMRVRPSAEGFDRSALRSLQQSDWDEGPALPHEGDFADIEERNAIDGPQQVQDASSSSASTAGPSPAEDDWAGMQRIVRSLARREDIPDGWWAEAGLSRILHQRTDGSHQDDNVNNDGF